MAALNILLTPVSSAPSLCPLPSLLLDLNSFLTQGRWGQATLWGRGWKARPAPPPVPMPSPVCMQI